MNRQIKNYCCLLIFLFISTQSFAQKQFHITIQFVPKLDTNNIKIMFDDGKGVSNFPVVDKNGKIEINCKVYSKYAYLNLHSPVTKSQKAYLITKETASITYYVNDKFVKDYPFVNSKLLNVIDLFDCKESKEIVAFTQKERKDLRDFREKYQDELTKNDSLKSIYWEKGKILEKKHLDFIKLKSDQYYYLWYFNFSFRNSEYFSADSLLKFYKVTLYPKYKNLFEAKRTLEYLETPPAKRKLYTTDFYAIAPLLKLNQMAPEFTSTDLSGRKFSLKQLRGKYVLLNFWATWCPPCVQELPLFCKLRVDYPEDQLEMISISSDRSKADCEKGIKKYGLTWTNVFNDVELIKKYEISDGIPLTFLIDKDGKLVYMHVGGLNNTEELRKLLMKH